MRNIVCLVLSATLTAGCMSPPPTAEEETRAAATVWHELLGAPGEPPPVAWATMGGKCLDLVRDVCADGLFDGEVAIVRWPGALPPSAFTHELMHAWLLRTTGDWDHDHVYPVWYREERINQVLTWRGM